MAEPTRSSVDGEAPKAFHVGNPPPTDEPLVGMVSHLLVSPLEVDHHRSSCCLGSFNQSVRAMLTVVFVFMLFNLTSIWNLSTISTGDRGHDNTLTLVGFFVCGRARKVALRGTPQWR